MRWLTNFYGFRFNRTASAAIGIHPTKAWLSQLVNFKNVITLKERYAIKFCFKLGKNDATETYGMFQTAFRASCMNRASVFEWYKRFKEGRESVRDDERCGRSKEVNTPELIGQRLGLGLGFPSVKGSTLQIGSVAFPEGQCTSPQAHPCHRLFDQDGHQDSSSPPYSQDLAPCDFGYSLSSEAVVMRQLRRWKRLWQKSSRGSHKRTSMGPCRSCWNGTST